ncbi:MAG: ChbG/HpnK family deacetylase [Thermoguttaceae bacterium]|nr:ChbG/HpnK family deacetylase [Thermoguttaceae bacterium]
MKSAPLDLNSRAALATADDLGLSPRVNRDIISLLEARRLNAASLFAHSPFAADALDEWAKRLGRRDDGHRPEHRGDAAAARHGHVGHRQ